MKKWFLIIGSIFLVMLIGSGFITLHGQGERSYQADVRQGRYDVIDHNYRDALNDFQGAQKVKPNDKKVSHELFQTQSYVSGNHYYYRHRLSLAAKNYHRSIKEPAILALTHRARDRNRLVNVLRASSSRFARWYDQALVLNHRRDFKASAHRLARITTDPNVNLPDFKSFKAKVLKLLKSDHRKDRSRQISDNVNRRAGTFKLRAPKIVTEHPSKVTVIKARHEIQRAGVNAHEMSNGDVTNVIRQARQHHSRVTKYAKANY